ncbi:hypothetical protein EAG_03299, partial [Camponotus floridanus]
KIEEQIQALYATKVDFQSKEIFVNHKMLLTMVDGKVCSVLAKQSFQKCYICGAMPKEMNNLASHSTRTIDPTTLAFGLSSLHSWIRCFEYRFRQEMGLLVDVPKPGYGSNDGTKTRLWSNDGNTARKFFSKPSLSASITGIDEQLIKRFAVILRIISSGYEINREEFETYTLDTAKLYVQLYNWYYMPASVHKLLIHNKQI